MYKYKIERSSYGLFFITLVWLVIIIHLYIPNMGGMGLALPQNIVSWVMMALLVFIIWLPGLIGRRRVLITSAAKLFLIGTLVLAVPLFYTRPEWRDMALWRWCGLLAGWIFYFSWLQVRLSQRARQLLFYGILLTIAIQALLATLQLVGLAAWLNYPVVNGRPYGVFQQVNMLASFVATGLALVLMLLLLPTFAMPQRCYERSRLAVLGALLVIFPVLLVWLQSRIGWLGGAVAGLLPLLCFGRYSLRRSTVVLLLLFAGVGLGLVGLWCEFGVGAVSHADSDGARGAMLRTGWAMLQDKPWLGWGVGGFEYNFQHFRLAQELSTEGLGVVVHPHNELLFWGVEGGAVALLGMLILLCGGGSLLIKAFRRDSVKAKRGHGEALALCIVLLPIGLHTQTEYPFDLSTVHWAVFLLLLAMLDRRINVAAGGRGLPSVMRKGISLIFAMPAVCMLALMSANLRGGLVLTQVERDGLRNFSNVEAMPRWAFLGQLERRQFDEQTHALLAYNRMRDESLLEGYAQWAQGYLERHIDANVYASLLLILRHQGQEVVAGQRQREATRLFPQDPRFQVQAAEPSKLKDARGINPTGTKE